MSLCGDNGNVHYNFTPPPIVYNYVDLDLPSHIKWATQNVGASKPSDYGLYFQWGDTSGYTADQVGKDKRFSWSDYKWSIDGSSTNFSEYTTKGAKLESEDDAVHVNMGGNWHMPTVEQIQELMFNTTSIWTTLDGVNGRLFTSKKDGTKSIFIPAAGSARGESVHDIGSGGVIWSSMLTNSNVSIGQYLYVGPFDIHLGGNSSRYYGMTVRGVIE